MSNLALTNVTYFDSKSMQYQQVDSILIENGRISSIDGPIRDDITKIDCKNKYVFPGFIDSHIHFFQSGGLFTRPDGLDLRQVKPYGDEFEDIKKSIPELFKRYLATGITGVVDCGGPFWNFEVLDQGTKLLAPRIAVAGPLVSTVSREKLDLGDPPIIKAENEEHARELVRRCVEHDPAFIKMWYIYLEDSFEEDSKIMKAAIEESKKQGYRAAVHATELETARRAVEYGADILVHSVFDQVVDQEFIDLVVKNKVIYIPTLMVRYGYRDVFRTRHRLSRYEQLWGDPSVIRSFRELMVLEDEVVPEPYRELRGQFDQEPEELNTASYESLALLDHAGAIIAAGTDAGNVGTLHGPALHTEMDLMVRAGMSEKRVLQSATLSAAKVLGRDDVGNITEEKRADLVILDRDPLEDISNTTSVWRTIIDGNVYEPTDLIQKTEPSTIIEQQVKAYNNRDIKSFLDTYHPRIKIYDLQSGQLLMEGLDQMRERYTTLFEESPELRANIRKRINLGDMVIDHEYVTGFRGDNSTEAIAYYEVKNHLITRVWFSR